MTPAKTEKRIRTKKKILSVTIRRMVDTSPDTSHLGEYSSRSTSQFTIDRAHAEDCASVQPHTFDSDGEWGHWNGEASDLLDRIETRIDEKQALRGEHYA